MANAHIYYTISNDGTLPEDPDNTSTPYTEAISLNENDIVKAIAYNVTGTLSSGIFSYIHSIIYTAAPEYATTGSTTVTFTGPTGSTIYYTTNGVDPVIGASGVTSHVSPVVIDFGGVMTDIRAIAKAEDLEQSCVVSMVTMGQPDVSIVTGDCAETAPRGNVIVIPIPSDGSTVWYAVTAGDNSVAPDPDAVPNPYVQYTDAVSLDDLDGINTHYTVHAYALSSDGQFKSSIASVSHQMKTAGKPELVPPVGSNPVVAISGGMFGDMAVCTIDMGTPDNPSDDVTTNSEIASDGTAEYNIESTATGTLTVAFKHGSWLPSCEATYTLAAAPAAPTWSQDCANKLSLACVTPMADIHYTTDNREPTLESPTYTHGCLDNQPVGTTIRAKAFTGYRASDELVYIYAATHSLASQIFVDGTNVVLSVSGHPDATIYFNSSSNDNNGNTMPAEPAEATTESTQFQTDPGITISGITIFSTIAQYGTLEASCPVRYVTRPGYSINSAADLPKIDAHPNDYFFVLNDIDASAYNTTVETFTGVIEGNGHTISYLTKPLFETATGAVIHDLALKDISVSAEGHVGAIAQTADGATRIYNCGILGSSSTVTTTSSSGTTYVGGLVGLLDGSARVINCYSYATINGGTHRAGIVGYNNVASTSGNLQTMVMNCMFYGNIAYEDGCTVYPVYGGENIHNLRANDNNTGLNNYCYFYYHGDYVNHIDNDNYHGSLGAEERFLNRFEFFRQTLNSTRNMAAFYVSGDATEKELIAKWVLDPIAPYPILKAPGYYPSRINLDADHAVPIDPDNVHYNEGRKLGTLTVNIEMGDGAQFNHPDGATIKTSHSQLTLNITDKDPKNFNFNYKKVQLPYYNQVGTMNYTNYRVVTGWKIVAVNGSTTGTGSFTTDTWYYPDWNFVDRACSNKDLYSVSGRVFSQGAYWEVPDGVTSITIQPYWAKAAYLSDARYDVTYNGANKYPVTVAGYCPTDFNGQTVRNAISGDNSAIIDLGIAENTTVYDYAVVLVGNYHQYAEQTLYNVSANKPVTFMSADLDGDCEPDNSLFYYHQERKRVGPVRFDFLNMPGIGMVKRTWNSETKPEVGIFKPVGWFEITNTVTVRFGQFEYLEGNSNNNTGKLFLSPLILQGGIYEQFVGARQAVPPQDKVSYFLLGGNAWFKHFANGCHTSTSPSGKKSPKRPVNVTGGDFEYLYLTGIYRPEVDEDPANAVCYIDGGRFGEVAGAGMQQIKGDVRWAVNAADIERFFGGGINGDKPITGDITTTISNSRVTEFYGGPKFGDVAAGKIVTTTATNCHFGLFFGAGYGGTSYNRYGSRDVSDVADDPPYNRTYCADYERQYNGTRGGISTNYEYEFILHSDGKQTVARFFVNYAMLSLASTRDVESTLTGCTIGTFYGGGRLGAVNGDVTSILTDCTVEGNVFGSGYSAETPSLLVMDQQPFVNPPHYNRRAGVFNDDVVEFPSSVQYVWKHADEVSTGNEFEDVGDKHYILTTANLDNLGAVLGDATLTIQGNSKVFGDVYGGGAKSSSNTSGGEKKITVNIDGGTYGIVGEGGTVTGGNIYGGGMGDLASLASEQDPEHSDLPVTEGFVEVNIGNRTQEANNVVINGSVFGCNNINGTPLKNVTVNIYKTKHNSTNTVDASGFALSQVFGGGNKAHYTPEAGNEATVHVWYCDNTIEYLYGGGNAANVGTTDVNSAANVIIDGGRIEWLFGGGNGAGDGNPGANINGNTNITFHAGDITYLFGGSNEKGTVTGNKTLSLLNDGSCSIPNHIAELYGGNNKAPIVGNVGSTLIMPCAANPCPIDYLFGGSRMADISGDVTLTIEGGNYNKVFGGNNLSGTISGNVTLNLHGGTIGSAFGGNKGGYIDETFYDGGTITGNITVNVEDIGDCPLDVENIFGAGDLAVYTAPSADNNYPVININHLRDGHPITGSVFGGGNGDPADNTQTKGSVTGNPKVIVGDLSDGHDSYHALISGNVYGGGNAAKLTGNTNVLIQKANSVVSGNVYGGGNLAPVSGSTTVTVTGGNSGDVYGGGALANVGTGSGTPTNVTLTGGTVRDIYGGGLGRLASGVDEAIAALVNGPVQVTVTGGTVTGSIYGCNNVNGAPQSTVNVDIYGTDAPLSGYALGKVFGGGNQADYPNTPVVKVHNCNNSIEYLYGGGNAASVQATDVTVYGGNSIGNVFGGCYGADVTTGGTNVKIYGGRIGKVFGGNNESGTVTGAISVNINKQGDDPNGTSSACAMYIGEVYGGGNRAASQAGTISVGCTGDLVALAPGEHYGIQKEGITYIYGGANEADITSGDIQLDMTSGIVENVFGGNNTSGAIGGTITVNINKNESSACPDNWYVGNVYGGGNHAAYSGTPDVNIMNGTVSGNVYGGGNDITDVSQGVANSDVVMTGGTVLGGIYGGCNLNGMVTGNSVVTVMGGVLGSSERLAAGTLSNVFGGGLGEGTGVGGDVTVTITRATGDNPPAAPGIYGDVYGGGALGNVNTNSSNHTTVNILDGTLYSHITFETHNGQTIYFYTGGNVYGGGLGRKAIPERSITEVQAKEFGVVTVNIGSGTSSLTNNGDNFTGNATIQGNVYCCNNTNGSPQDNVIVNIYRTAHTTTDAYDYTTDNGSGAPTFAIANVFGGGNEANYSAPGKKATVNILGCYNSIGRLFGGGNAAGTPSVISDIQGGRIGKVFGGGNGERGSSYAANINGTVEVNMHGGSIGESFGGSNQNGVIMGTINITIDNEGPCGGITVEDHFCGGKSQDHFEDMITTVNCNQTSNFINFYAGCDQANITGNVVLNLYGGHYTNVFGGSKGDLASLGGSHVDKAANITGNVTLNLYGGTMENVYGGSNVNGNIQGVITVNVLDVENPNCPLDITNIYGGSNMTNYTPNLVAGEQPVSPIVNVVHILRGVKGNVYGGSRGIVGTEVDVNSNPQVNIGYTTDMVGLPPVGEYNPALYTSRKTTIYGNVFGGGDAATVKGNTVIRLNKGAKVFRNVYGGGNMGEVTGVGVGRGTGGGNTQVFINGKKQ